MFRKRVIILTFLTFIIIANIVGCRKEESGEMRRNMSTMEVVQELGLGINLGNTFESCGEWINHSKVSNYETAWGSPIITKQIIQGYADVGFGVLRIPVAWSNMMTDNYEINTDYIKRVKEVVDWTLESGMYSIVNIHYDGGWFAGFATNEDESMYKYERIWTQLSEAFKDYSDHLILESLNEEGGWDSIWNRWSGEGDKEKSYNLLNQMNQKFVDIIRQSGGNNTKRHLLIAGYNTDIELTCDEAFKMPIDPENRLAVSVHYYHPADFTILEEDAEWAKMRTEWGSDDDMAVLEKYMTMLKETFVDNGIPVIIGEYGMTTKNRTPEMIRNYLTSVSRAGYIRGMCPVLWDITNVFYNRREAKFIDPELLRGLMEIKEFKRNK